MSKIKVYLDNCCYNRPYDDQDQLRVFIETQAKLQIQEMIRAKEIDLVYSFVSEYENNANPNKKNRGNIAKFFGNASVYVDISHRPEIRAESVEIMKTGIKLMDSLQVAAAIVGRAKYFLTTDKRLLKYSSDKIIIMNPTDFIREMEV